MTQEYGDGHMGWMKWRHDARRDHAMWAVLASGIDGEPFLATASQWDDKNYGLYARIDADGTYSHGTYEPSIEAADGVSGSRIYTPDTDSDGDESGEPKPAGSMADAAAMLARVMPCMRELAPWFFTDGAAPIVDDGPVDEDEPPLDDEDDEPLQEDVPELFEDEDEDEE